MKFKSLSVMVLCAAVLGSGATRAGEVTTRKDVRDLTIGGKIHLEGIHRDAHLLDLNNATPGVGIGSKLRRPQPFVGGVQQPDKSGSETFVVPKITLDLTASLAKKVKGYFELGTNNPFANGNAGGTSTPTPMGSVFRDVGVRQSYIELDEFLLPNRALSLIFGVKDYKIALRENGQSFFFDPRNANNPFFGAVNNGVVGVTGGVSASVGSIADGTGPGTNTSLAFSHETGGTLVRYDTSALLAEGFYWTLAESFDSQTDRQAWGGHIELKFPQESKLTGTFLVYSNASNVQIYNYAAGADMFIIDTKTHRAEIYGEAVTQHGVFLRNATDLTRDDDVRQKAYAFYTGARYDLRNFKLKPFVDGQYGLISGDRVADDDVNKDFVSYESWGGTLIMEDSSYGLNLNANYQVWRAAFGLKMDWVLDDGIEDDVELVGAYNYFSLFTKHGRAPRKLGEEIDVTLNWRYTSQLSIFGGVGTVVDPDGLSSLRNRALNLATFGMKLEF